jgi:hypothetical protein
MLPPFVDYHEKKDITKMFGNYENVKKILCSQGLITGE